MTDQSPIEQNKTGMTAAGAVVSSGRSGKTPPAALILYNALPIIGVVFLRWSVGEILLLYWVENIVIGFFNVFKMILAQGKVENPAETEGDASKPDENVKVASPAVMKMIFVPFFFVHYGGFCAGHGVFLFLFFGESMGLGGGSASEAFSLVKAPLVIGVIVLCHAITFFTNYIGAGEYKWKSPTSLMAEPYGRIFVLHVVVILCGVVLMVIPGDSFLKPLFVIIVKTALEIFIVDRMWRKMMAQQQKQTSASGGPQ